ncbi:MAG: hypothetical protein WBC01_10065 [Solirubrobacterales bacterium]
MKRYLALALAGVIGLSAVSLAVADDSVQTEEAKIKPTKLSKKKHQNIKLINTITTFNAPGTFQPPKGVRTVVDWPKQLKFNLGAVPVCNTDASGLGLTATTEDAIAACGKKSVVSDPKGSTAEVTVGGPTSVALTIDVQVTAFNENGKQLILYAKPIGANSGIPASILEGKLKKSKAGKKYGMALDVTIPPLAAGAISFFEVTVKKSKYIQAKCKPEKMTFQATTFFSDAPTSSDTHSIKCKPKKK